MTTKGIIFDLKKFAVHDGPGIRTTVFFKGCPMRCWWCHNPESQNLAPVKMVKTNNGNASCIESEEIIGREVMVDEIMQEIEKDLIFYDQSGGGVTFSGGEPLMQPEFLNALLTECKQKEIHTAVDTSGFVPWEIVEMNYAKVDLFLYDLKIIDDRAHQKYTDVSNQQIKENLNKLTWQHANICIRIPVIPGITDTDVNLSQLAKFILSLNNIKMVNLLPYNSLGKNKYTKLNLSNKSENLQVQSDQEMNTLKKKFSSFGLEVKIGG